MNPFYNFVCMLAFASVGWQNARNGCIKSAPVEYEVTKAGVGQRGGQKNLYFLILTWESVKVNIICENIFMRRYKRIRFIGVGEAWD